MPAWAGLLLAMVWSGGVLAVPGQERTLCLDALQPQVQARYGFLPHPEDALRPQGDSHTAGQGDAWQRLQDHVLYASYDFDIPESDSQSENDTENSEQEPSARVEGQSTAEDVLSVDFTLLSGRVLVPTWWACGGVGDTLLTVGLVAGDILDDRDQVSEDIRDMFGDIFYFHNMREAEAVVGGADAFNLSSPAKGAWEALEELRWLWQDPHGTHWKPHLASPLTRQRDSPTPTPPPESKGALPPPGSVTLAASECFCDTECDASDGGSGSGGAPLRPYEQFFTPSNVSADVFPGCLHPQVLTRHLRAPSASPWHAFRYAVDHHMHLTGVPRFPSLAATTFRLPAASCPAAPTPPGTSHQPPGSAAAGGRVGLDVTVLLQAWLDEVAPWQRRTSRITLMFFKSEHNLGGGAAGAGQQEPPSQPPARSSAPVDDPPSCHTPTPVRGDNTTQGRSAAPGDLPASTSPRLSVTYKIDGKWTERFLCHKVKEGGGSGGQGLHNGRCPPLPPPFPSFTMPSHLSINVDLSLA